VKMVSFTLQNDTPKISACKGYNNRDMVESITLQQGVRVYKENNRDDYTIIYLN